MATEATQEAVYKFNTVLLPLGYQMQHIKHIIGGLASSRTDVKEDKQPSQTLTDRFTKVT